MTVESGVDAEVDEFDLDLRLGELATWHLGHPTHLLGGAPLVDAQSDGDCLPTGGRGWGPTCNTQNDTCPATCAGRDTCAATCAGQNTCPQTNCGNTCGNTCGFTCPQTDCGNSCPVTCGGFCNTASCQGGGNCQIP